MIGSPFDFARSTRSTAGGGGMAASRLLAILGGYSRIVKENVKIPSKVACFAQNSRRSSSARLQKAQEPHHEAARRSGRSVCAGRRASAAQAAQIERQSASDSRALNRK